MLRTLEKISLNKHSDTFLSMLDKKQIEIIEYLKNNKSQDKIDLFV